jgi:hypothetical protein
MVIVDLFDSIVDKLRATGSITNKVESGTTTTIESVNALSAGEVVTMDAVDYVVSSATATEFTVEATGLTATEWKAKAPYYLYGHPTEMVNTLTKKGTNDVYKYQKYPLVYLEQDFTEDVSSVEYYAEISRLTIVILTNTSANFSSIERYNKTFKPILYPLYTKFIEETLWSGSFSFNLNFVNHDKTDRLFWGTKTAMGNEKNILNDPIDAIEITLKDLKVFNEKCN